MSTDVTASETPAAPVRPTRRAGAGVRGIVVENLAVVVVLGLAGVAAGWVWQRWATPASGVVLDGSWRLGYRIEGDFLVGDATTFERAFGVIGTYLVVCGATGLVLGVLVALVCRRAELVTLAAVALGSALAAFACYRVGLALGPDDPAVAARTAADGTVLSGDLGIDRLAPFVAFPLLALVGLAVTYMLTTTATASAAGARRNELPPPADPVLR